MIEILLSVAVAVLSGVVSYVLYRMWEIVSLAQEIIRAYDDQAVTEEEYGLIVDGLRRVVYKK